MTTQNAGIDYGLGKSNINHETGIRFGVISQNEVLQAWADSSEPILDCEDCECWDSENEECKDGFCDAEVTTFELSDGEYEAFSDEYGDIMILKSPYFTYAQFCSPCAPGACHLESPLNEPNDNNKCYCFGHDWFDDGKAPYDVYSVETGEIIK